MLFGGFVEKAGFIVLTFKFRKRRQGWSGYCEELGTAVDGKTIQETRDLLEEFVQLHLNSLEDINERENFFREHNIRLHPARPRGKVHLSVSVNEETFTSPHIYELSKVAAS